MDNTSPPPAPQRTPIEEPEVRQEEAIPSDGKDSQGEQMMEDLGRHKPGQSLSPDKGT